jgi:hypothetical protein
MAPADVPEPERARQAVRIIRFIVPTAFFAARRRDHRPSLGLPFVVRGPDELRVALDALSERLRSAIA